MYYVVFGIPYIKTFAISKGYKYFKCAENFRYKCISILLNNKTCGNINPFSLVYIRYYSDIISKFELLDLSNLAEELFLKNKR